jgi:hypothetical protein
MGSGMLKAAAVNLLVKATTQRRDTMFKKTAATSNIQITATTPTLMLAMELSEEEWKLGFSSAFGQEPLVRNMGSR